MEGVGARLGRSSSRYGTATVFTGPVRKWKKKWVHVSNPKHSNNLSNGNINSHLLLYKWTPISSSQNNSGKDAAATPTVPEERPRKKFRFVPVSVTEEQNEAAAKNNEETNPTDVDLSPRPRQSDDSDGKSDVNDVMTDEAQISRKDRAVAVAPLEVRETNLDLSLGLKGHVGESQTDVKTTDQGESGRADPGEDAEMKSATVSEAEDRCKKDPVPDLEMRV